MQAVRDFLPGQLRQNMEKALGAQETLRLLWPTIIGARLAAAVRLKQVRGRMLIVAVPDRVWQGSLAELEHLIVDAVNRSGQSIHCTSVRFLVDEQAGVAQENSHAQPLRTREEPAAALPQPETGDAGTREIFARSAAKYFARQPEPLK